MGDISYEETLTIVAFRKPAKGFPEQAKILNDAFGYYDYGAERGLITVFPSRDAAAAFICGYVRMALQSGILYTTGENVVGIRKYADLKQSPPDLPRSREDRSRIFKLRCGRRI